MYELRYAPLDEYAGLEETAYDWALWGTYDNLYKALFVMMKAVEEDVEDNSHYAYRIVETDA